MSISSGFVATLYFAYLITCVPFMMATLHFVFMWCQFFAYLHVVGTLHSADHITWFPFMMYSLHFVFMWCHAILYLHVRRYTALGRSHHLCFHLWCTHYTSSLCDVMLQRIFMFVGTLHYAGHLTCVLFMVSSLHFVFMWGHVIAYLHVS
jgi:hypothetical protein